MVSSLRRTRVRLSFTILLVTFFAQVLTQNFDVTTISEEPVEITPNPGLLFNRALAPGTCTSSIPCPDGSCCNSGGFCGLTTAFCSKPGCISNCNATASSILECGTGAINALCPLSVCCSKWGFCGVTADFCTAGTGTPGGCQSNCDQPPATTLSSGSVQNLVIGYWGAWALEASGCGARGVADIPIDSLTHLNVAFAFIDPIAFILYPIPTASAADFAKIVNLKHTAPGLQMYDPWLSIGGWTFNDLDNTDGLGASTQPTFSKICSSAANRQLFIKNLIRFMKQYGFDGLDIDWEYPGAPDRGGSTFDGAGYVSLLSDIKDAFKTASPTGGSWGLSFTAPTSYWYLRWFKIGDMMKYVNWVNLMTYDLHGSWDSPSDDIGSFVYGHTNLTEIKDALNLLWRNAVPANQVNLGLGFYGRTYTLSDPTCVLPGCPFLGGGFPGLCTGQSGILSYDELTAVRKRNNPTVIYDKVAAVKYFSWPQHQWASYDDVDTLKLKVDFAGKMGLLGIFIWGIDLDNKNHDALNAVLQPTGLGKFSKQNGVGSNMGLSTYVGAVGDSCIIEDCGAPGVCQDGYMQMGPLLDCVGVSGQQPLCCPLSIAPDPGLCDWNIGNGNALFGTCQGACAPGENRLAESRFPSIPNFGSVYCQTGFGEYCCKTSDTLADVCAFEGICRDLDSNNVPINACTSDTFRSQYVTYQGAPCGGSQVNAFCCKSGVDASSCQWMGHEDDNYKCVDYDCVSGQTKMGSDENGGGQKCTSHTYPADFDGWWDNAVDWDQSLCCSTTAMAVNLVEEPFDINHLFPGGVPSTDNQNIDLDVDTSLGTGHNSEDPDENSFGMAIMSGPATEITSFDKRDGSHWELYDCPTTKHEGRQTVKAICTDDSIDSNCGIIWTGTGVEHTVVELPHGCSIGRYAVAISLERTKDPKIPQRLVKRGLGNKAVYDLTFDFNFKPLQGRASNVLLRIDYSDVAGYWDDIILPAGDLNTKRKRDIEVQEKHGGSYKRWLEHTFRQERRDTPEHKLHELHARWFSLNPDEWYDKFREVDTAFNGPRRDINGKYTLSLIDETLECGTTTFPVRAVLQCYANLQYDIHVASGAALIGNLGNYETWKQSNVYLRTTGNIVATFVFDAFAKISFTTGQFEIFGMQNFPSPFTVAGLVTIGPNLRVVGELSGQATLHAGYISQLEVATWDYIQRYPPPKGVTPDNNSPTQITAAPWAPLANPPKITWDVTATGQIVAHIIPKVELGIIFATDLLGDCTVGTGVDMYMRVYANASVSNTQPTPTWCYGVDGGARLFAYVTTPTMFGYNYNRDWTPWSRTVNFIGPTCAAINVKLNGGEPGGF